MMEASSFPDTETLGRADGAIRSWENGMDPPSFFSRPIMTTFLSAGHWGLILSRASVDLGLVMSVAASEFEMMYWISSALSRGLTGTATAPIFMMPNQDWINSVQFGRRR